MKKQGARSKTKIRKGREGDITGDETKKTRMSAQFSWICMSKGTCCLQFSCFPGLVSSLKMADHCPTLQQSKSCILLNSESRHFNMPIMFHGLTTDHSASQWGFSLQSQGFISKGYRQVMFSSTLQVLFGNCKSKDEFLGSGSLNFGYSGSVVICGLCLTVSSIFQLLFLRKTFSSHFLAS